jgi:hypothetical protein
MRMQRRLVALLGPAALGLGLSACAVRTTTMPEPSYPPPGGYARAPGAHVEHQETVAVGTVATEYYTESYPPEPLYEAMAPSPGDDQVWIDGSWHWNGYEWVWLGGSWVPEPVDLVYIEPHYGYQDDYYVYRPGHWTRREHIPRGVIVRDHRRHRPVTGHYPRPERPHYRVPIEGDRHGHRPPHTSPQPGDSPGTPLVRDHRSAGNPGNGAPPPRTGPPPRHQGPDQAGPPTVPRRPPPDISSPAPRGIPASRPGPRDHRNPAAPPPPRGIPSYGGPPPRSAPGPRDHRNPAAPPPPRGVPSYGGPPPRSAPGPRDHRNPAAPPPPRSAPAPRGGFGQGAPPPRSAPGPREHRSGAGNVSGTVRPQRPAGPPPRRR